MLMNVESEVLKDVHDEIGQGNLDMDDPILQKIDEHVEVDNNEDKAEFFAPETQMLSVDSGRAIPDTTQNILILPNEEFDEVVRADLQLIKQAWAAAEKGEEFILVINKSRQKKIKQLARSRGQPYNTRSTGGG
ncbi:hypothetical protein L195_g040119 [Trifolium pratense]|uniref:Uncharacterized protein n=1 Tax=Trifolium pratense TaxID=57577 RepID=A0A2K3LZW4_TRIPR|nr:hypothetical protein L195_g040119 [Trifolium pratense]